MPGRVRSVETDPQLERVHRFFAGTGSTYDRMVHYATFGIDGRWKRRIVDLIPPQANRILDLACGTGLLTFAIARRYPRCQVIGVELRDEYLAIARRKAKEQKLSNVEFVLSRAEAYRDPRPCDAIVSSYLAKYADLPRLTAHTHDMLRDYGIVVMHDFTFPSKPSLVRIWRLYFWLLQGLGSRLYPAWREIYYGLPALIEETRWLEELTTALTACQFADIRVQYLTLYGSAIVTARKDSRTTATGPARSQGA